MASSTTSSPLEDLFAAYLNQLEKLEKATAKIYKKLAKAALTAELCKCLAPLSTDIDKHIERIGLIKLTELSGGKNSSTAAIEMVIKLRKPTLEQDLQIISEAMRLQHQKLALYELLHPMAMVLNLSTEAELIEQTVTDDRNTNTWLRQIIQNIIAPTWHEA